MLLSFDPNIRFALWESKEEARQNILWGMNYADILKISEEELAFVTGNSDLEKGAQELQQQYDIGLLVVTLAEKGCYYRLASLDGYVPGFKVKAIDTTGAGDAFLGCLLYRLLESGSSLQDLTSQQITSMLTFANAGGALVTTRKGALGSMPTTEEINQMIESSKESNADRFQTGLSFLTSFQLGE